MNDSAGRLTKGARARADIMRVAMEEFADRGLSGARIDDIAARTATSKRMIFHYFKDKKTLYLRVLEEAYRTIRRREAALGLERMPPASALRLLVEETFDHHEAHPEFVRLITIENIHHGENIVSSEIIREENKIVIPLIEDILQRGYASGEFTKQADPVNLHYLITSTCIFRVTHRYTFSSTVGRDIFDAGARSDMRTILVQAMLSLVGYSGEPVSAENASAGPAAAADRAARPKPNGRRSRQRSKLAD